MQGWWGKCTLIYCLPALVARLQSDLLPNVSRFTAKLSDNEWVGDNLDLNYNYLLFVGSLVSPLKMDWWYIRIQFGTQLTEVCDFLIAQVVTLLSDLPRHPLSCSSLWALILDLRREKGGVDISIQDRRGPYCVDSDDIKPPQHNQNNPYQNKKNF